MENTGGNGMKLIKKGKRGLLQVVFGRTGIFVLLILLQLLFYFALFVTFNSKLPYFYSATLVYSFFVVLLVLNSSIDASAKITWVILILLLPIFGSFLYWFVLSDAGHISEKKRYKLVLDESEEILRKQAEQIAPEDIERTGAQGLIHYLYHVAGYPMYKNTNVTYFRLGEEKFETLLKELKKAEKSIFLEYFIIEEGLMWGKILEILVEKAKAGVDVRVMYDGTCEFLLLPHSYPKELEKLGIKCKVFSPIMPVLSTHYNYRDHRKILVIDDKVAFNGGVNLADEYINHIRKYGHWKDVAVMLEGEAVKSFTLMFLQMWNMDENQRSYEVDEKTVAATEQPAVEENDDKAELVSADKNDTEPESSAEKKHPSIEADGFVIPYSDEPLDDDKVGERVYTDLLNRATKYVHIMSPYLILDGELESALEFAAKRGVEVALILPGIPDKRVPYAIAKTHYRPLLAAGVKIYEYTPGFVHAKVCVCDDAEAVVGTINFDYRSLYHHFECATYMNRVSCITEIEKDFLATREKCRTVTKETIWQGHRALQPIGFLLKWIAPML